ncbi:DUF4190 domain-containing protein [Kitasatospora sp. Root107]|uniref:DUF4190 domain-containing protein n=1 Tax=Kitasatospora sp. Root107 TaxID=1736424 RepID=UPI000710F16F|nr:DUF4190 domain-containing protein [Kitasatospora sp. Root107]KQV10932.1 hypothetical protein ASC99_36165 [Kitasatospora sp. Root107]
MPPSDPYTPPADPYAQQAGPYAQPGPPGAAPYPGQWAGAPAPYGQPYWTAPQVPAQGTNGLAITSLVLGILGFGCFLWVLGLGFGIGALRQIRRRPQQGKGLAVAGIVISCLWAVLTIGLVGVLVAKGDLDSITSQTNVFSLQPGDCLKEKTGGQGQLSRRFTVVPCTEPHYGEVFGTVPLSAVQENGSSYPGEKVLEEAAAKACVRRQYEYAADYLAIPRGMEVSTLYPDRTSWKAGTSKRFGLCLFESKETTTRTLHQDYAAATSEQHSYLTASTELDQVLDQWPLDDPADAAPGAYQDWARQVVSAAEAEKSQLRLSPWTDGPAAKVGPLQAELDQVIAHAEKIRKATDPTVLEDELLELEDYVRGPADTEFRAALKLPTSYPDARPASV